MRRIVKVRFLSTKVHVPEFKRVGVVGLGLMGHGVAQMAAQAGFEVMAIESSPEALATGMKRIQGSMQKVLSKDVQKGKITEAESKIAFDKVMSRFTTTTSTADARDCDLIVEAIIENIDIKLDFYKNLGKVIKPEGIFASNTSSLQITAMGVASGRPERFVGLHFFNPVQLMKLVEVVRTDSTAPEVFDAVTAWGKQIGKVTVSCKDTPGFIVNRLLVPYMAQAMAMLDRGDASVGDIDVSMQLGAGHPMGPLHLADYVGLDTCMSILQGWSNTYPEETAFRVPASLAKLVAAGHYGRKSGRGFYKWNGDKVLEVA